MRFASLSSIALAALLPASVGAATSVTTPDGALPPILEGIEIAAATNAIDVARSGALAALSEVHGERKGARSTLIVLASGAPTRRLELEGHIRDILFSPDGSELFVVQERAGRKRRAAECFLLRIDVASLKTRREIYLPATSRSLAHWPQRDALLVAVENEVRTLLLPDLRSGPLYRILGDNRAIAVMGGSQVLIGQADRMVVVDLADRPGHDEMPRRAELAVTHPVVDIALAEDGRQGVARLEGDRVARLATRPLGLADIGTGLVWSAGSAAPASEPDPDARTIPAPPPVAVVVVEPDASPAPEPAVAAAAAVEGLEAPPPEPEPVAVEAAPDGAPRVAGTVVGPGIDASVRVVALGPDNLLREAVRVAVFSDGSFSIDDLAPGRYRIVVDGGGGRVAVTEPQFHVVEIVAGARVAPVAFTIVRWL